MLAHVRETSKLDRVLENGSTVRENWEAAARAGDMRFRAKLDSIPPCPETHRYLLEWAYQLLGRSGMGLDGYAPLSYSELRAWKELCHWHVTADEVTALLALDAALRDTGRSAKPAPREKAS